MFLFQKLKMFIAAKKNFDITIKKSDKILCAKFRPGHFEGVLSVINQFLKKLILNIYFWGKKIISNYI